MPGQNHTFLLSMRGKMPSALDDFEEEFMGNPRGPKPRKWRQRAGDFILEERSCVTCSGEFKINRERPDIHCGNCEGRLEFKKMSREDYEGESHKRPSFEYIEYSINLKSIRKENQ